MICYNRRILPRRRWHSMAHEHQPIDISTMPDVLRLAEAVRRSGVGHVLKRGEETLALLTPVAPKRSRRRSASSAERDALLNIIGIGASTEPTDIAQHERRYLAEAYESRA